MRKVLRDRGLRATLDCGPMDADAFALHSAEPGHLTLGKLMDRGGQLGAHLLECEFPGNI